MASNLHHTKTSYLLPIILVLGLGACGGRSGPPAPVIDMSGAGSAAKESRSRNIESGRLGSANRPGGKARGGTRSVSLATGRLTSRRAQVVRVGRGDTLYGIARRHKVPLRAVIDANRLLPPYGLKAGSRLRIPAVRVYVVAKGDTVYEIARQTGISPRQIIAANNLKAPYTLHPGDVLVVTGGRLHEVKKGETLYSISRSYGVDLRTLTLANNMKRPYTLTIGQRLKIPGGAPVRQTVLEVNLPPRTGSKFMWPVTGKILSSFGPKAGGLHNDGINIKARRGDQVRAAEAGVVVYAGDDLKGYGNLLLIRHSGGWVTAYAHSDRLLVKRGDRVTQGQVIAWVGITGGVSEPQVHFEIRKGTVAVDPIKYLNKG